jgi:hypothetical protein
MEYNDSIIAIVSAALEIVGLFLLAREVSRGRNMEELTNGLEFARRLQFLYAKQDYEGIVLACRLDQGDTPAAARKWVEAYQSSNSLAQTAQRFWEELEPAATKSLKRWQHDTVPLIMNRRQRDLVIGTILLMLAAAIHLLAHQVS